MKKYIIGIACLFVGLGVAFSASAVSGSFMDLVAKWTGYFNSEKMSAQISSESQKLSVGDETVLGSVTAHPQSMKHIVQKTMSASTNTFASIANPESATVFVDKVGYCLYPDLNSLTGTGIVGTRIVDVGTSTGIYTSSTWSSVWKGLSFSTSSNYVCQTTSTYTNGNDRRWGASEYMNFQVNIIASTSGFAFVEYWNP